MAYDSMETNSPGAGQGEMDDDDEQNSDTAYLPASALGGRKYGVGDKITLEVVSVDDDSGDVEVKCLSGGGGMGKSGGEMIDEMEG